MEAINSSGKEVIYFPREKLLEFNVLNDKGYSHWGMYPYKDTLMTYSINNASSYAYNLAEKITISCNFYNNNRPTIMLDIYKSTKTSEASKLEQYDIGGVLSIDEQDFDLGRNDIQWTAYHPSDAG